MSLGPPPEPEPSVQPRPGPPSTALPGWAPPVAQGWNAPPPGWYGPPPGFGPPPRPSKRFGWGAVIGGLVAGLVIGGIGALVVAGLAVAFSGGFDDVQYTAGSHGPLGRADVAEVGDCLRSSAGETDVGDRQEVVSCARHHGSEVLGVISAPASAGYPGRTDLDYFVDGACAIAYRGYVGTAYDDSDLDYSAIVPTRAAWRADDRRVWCLLDSSLYRDGRGSARGSGA